MSAAAHPCYFFNSDAKCPADCKFAHKCDKCAADHPSSKCTVAVPSVSPHKLFENFMFVEHCAELSKLALASEKPFRDYLKVGHGAIEKWPESARAMIASYESRVRQLMAAAYPEFAQRAVSELRFALLHGKTGYACKRHTDVCHYTGIVYMSRPASDAGSGSGSGSAGAGSEAAPADGEGDVDGDYAGGQLVFADWPSARLRLAQGTLVIFPAHTPHLVDPVTRGERFIFNFYYWLAGKQSTGGGSEGDEGMGMGAGAGAAAAGSGESKAAGAGKRKDKLKSSGSAEGGASGVAAPAGTAAAATSTSTKEETKKWEAKLEHGVQ